MVAIYLFWRILKALKAFGDITVAFCNVYRNFDLLDKLKEGLDKHFKLKATKPVVF